jgi:hypothetical protein
LGINKKTLDDVAYPSNSDLGCACIYLPRAAKEELDAAIHVDDRFDAEDDAG